MLVAVVSLDPIRKPCVFLGLQTVTHPCGFPATSVTLPAPRSVIFDAGRPRAVLHTALNPGSDLASAMSLQAAGVCLRVNPGLSGALGVGWGALMEPRGQKQEKKHRCPKRPDFLGPIKHTKVLLRPPPLLPLVPTGIDSAGGEEGLAVCSGSGVPVSPWDCDREQRATPGAPRVPGRAGNELRWSPAPGRGPGLVYHPESVFGRLPAYDSSVNIYLFFSDFCFFGYKINRLGENRVWEARGRGRKF